jgi:hypothetical protein
MRNHRFLPVLLPRAGTRLAVTLFAGLVIAGCVADGKDYGDRPRASDPAAVPVIDKARILLIGQDLDAIRGYMASDCCPTPDGLTAYIDFYDIFTPDDFGGLGLDLSGNPTDLEFDWAAGPVSAYKTATEFGIDRLAIGLSITENEHPGGLDRIVAGMHDKEIRQLAHFFSMIEGPVYLRIGYEFDGAWNQGYYDAERFVQVFRRIVYVLRAEGSDNVQFVWQGAAAVVDQVIDGGYEDVRQWYPGDDYVDWMGLSWFMNPDETIQIESPAYVPPTPSEMADEIFDFARKRGKPVMIAEASPQAMDLLNRFVADHSPIWDGHPRGNRVDMSNQEIWEHWFGPLFDLMNENDDVIRGLAYINVNWDSQEMWGPPYASGFWGDSRLEVNQEIARRFSAAIDDWRAKN